ncbi:NF-kappa-B inhibitor-interacting Ras-like protein 2 [Hydractinia symbiolongicarpus]|uniref:NF-kappa-B inhibitor-interacting Ras-like protein 2 n=1 Tax=Hydractinia symbiolongicarpus TaxID=13093 RepID=UPI00254FBE04|nr:NF-kappa-B inhibitor-interacting Ras-like protein 2 [Hydractinia symbiolongicarpus]
MGIEHCGQVNILILGDKGVGKSTICSEYAGEELSSVQEKEKGDIPIKTNVFLGDGKKECIKEYDVHITTSNGIFRRETVQEYKQKILRSDGYVLIYSIDNRASYIKLINLLGDIQRTTKDNVPIVIFRNKIDIKVCLPFDEQNLLSQDIPQFNVSGRTNEGVQKGFKTLVQLCVNKL